MTDDQKKKVVELRKQGCGYTTIAKALGLKKDAIVAICRKHGLTGQMGKRTVERPMESTHCNQCGAELTQMPGGRQHKFCSEICRHTWWNNHPEALNRKAFYPFTCAGCGRSMSAYGNTHRKYCSHLCYINTRFNKAHPLPMKKMG